MKTVIVLLITCAALLQACTVEGTRTPDLAPTLANGTGASQPPPTVTPTLQATKTPVITPSPLPTATIPPTPSPTPLPVEISRENLSALSLVKVFGRDAVFPPIDDLIVNPQGNQILILGDSTIFMDLETKETSLLDGQKTAPSFSPDGVFLALANPDFQIEVWDTGQHQIVASLEAHEDALIETAWSPDGKRLASLSQDGKFMVWDIETGKPVNQAVFQIKEFLETALEWSPDGKHIAMVGFDDVVRVFNGEQIVELQGHSEVVTHLDWSPDGSFLVTSSNNEPNVILWRIANFNQVAVMSNHQYWVSNVEWSPDGEHLATADAAGTVFIRNAQNGETQTTITKDWTLEYPQWSPDGKYLLCLHRYDGGTQVQVYDVATEQPLPLPEGLITMISQAIWIPNSEKIILQNSDHRVQIWDISSNQLDMLIDRPIGYGSQISPSPGEDYYAIGELGGNILIFDVEKGEIVNRFKNHASPITDLSWSPDGTMLAVTSMWDDRARIWNPFTGEELKTVGEGFSRPLTDWSSGQVLAIAGEWGGNISFWDPETGKRLNEWEPHNNVIDLQFAPDGKLFSSAGWGELMIMDAHERKLIKNVTYPENIYMYYSAWSPDGGRLALLQVDMDSFPDFEATCQILDAASFEEVISFEVNQSNGLTWSPDGTMIGFTNGEIRDSATGELLHDMIASGQVSGSGFGNFMIFDKTHGEVSWSADGNSLIFAGNGLEFWGVDPAKLPCLAVRNSQPTFIIQIPSGDIMKSIEVKLIYI